MKDKIVLITGASSGIGLACAREFAKRKAKLILAARSIDKLNKIKKELSTDGVEVITLKIDVSVEEDCKYLINEAINKFGKIDILINNAGVSMRALFVDLDLKVVNKIIDTNFWGTIYCTKYALPYLLESEGSVVGVSGVTGLVSLPGRTGYCASKYAIVGFLKALRIENLKTGLHVMIASPGFTSTNIRKTALLADGSIQGESPREEDKMMSSEVVALKIINAIEKRKRLLILTFQGKLVILLRNIFPKLVDKLIYKYMAKEPGSPFK